MHAATLRKSDINVARAETGKSGSRSTEKVPPLNGTHSGTYVPADHHLSGCSITVTAPTPPPASAMVPISGERSRWKPKPLKKLQAHLLVELVKLHLGPRKLPAGYYYGKFVTNPTSDAVECTEPGQLDVDDIPVLHLSANDAEEVNA
jgi:hypothetical protein